MTDHKYTPLEDVPFPGSSKSRGLRFLSISLHGLILSIVGLVGFLAGSYGNFRWTRSSEHSWSKFAVRFQLVFLLMYFFIASDLSSITRTAVKFQGSFDFRNPFRGPPSEAIDREWDRFTAHRE